MRLLALIFACAAMALAGCADIPIKDGELIVGKSTTATMDDMGVARVKNQF